MSGAAGRTSGLRLPTGLRACLFDLDGVLTPTAVVHARAWRETFDEYLRARAQQQHERFVPFDPGHDYDEYVDGRPRNDGVRSFLASRGIRLPDGSASDPPGTETVAGIGNAKNERVLQLLDRNGVKPYEGSVRFVHAVRAHGLGTAVVSASTNCAQVLAAAGISDLFDARVDGLVADRDGLRGKPEPDTFLAAARMLDVEPSAGAVFEDALAGVSAGKAGRFGLVVGVDRVGQREALLAHGADTVVDDLAELLA